MSNAAKYKKKAAELELQKQFDKAVAMYVRAIEAGDAEGAEVDVAVLNKVGDLTLRLGRVGEAVTSYERAVEHYTTVGLFNNAIALCNKILRHAPGRAGIYLTLGRVCTRKGMRGDATRNFLEYASRMQQEGRTDEAMRSLAEVAGLMPELEEVRRLVEEHAERVGIALPAVVAPDEGSADVAPRRDSLVFLDIDYDVPAAPTPALGTQPIAARPTPLGSPAAPPAELPLTSSLDDLLIFDPLSEEAPPEEPTALDGLEALPNVEIDSDAPSLLTPTALVAVDPSVTVADGLTDALGYGVADEQAPEVPLQLDGLVSDADGDTVVTPLSSESLPAVELPTLTPYRGVEAVTPPPLELETLSPYEGVSSITPPAEPSVAAVELDTLSPYDGVASVTPPSEAALPVVGLESLDPQDTLEATTPPALELIGSVDLDDAIERSSPADEDVAFAELLVRASLPPSHSTRPARVIPRLNPHDFILSGELPPILLPDRYLAISAPQMPPIDVPARTVDASAETPEAIEDAPRALDDDLDVVDRAPLPSEAFGGGDDLGELEAALTPAESTAAFDLARDRCARLREEVEAHPGDWARRRRLAEALLEAGERATGLEELAATALGLELEGALPDAVRVLDDLVRVAPEQVAYHQKRVELAVRLGDRDRLRESYLDLADALVRSGHAVRAEPVYVRVLELDPWDDRARAALGDAAPPPPSPKPSAAPADDGYVNLADWLADDAAPRDTRMRVKEPTVTGDEDADFDQLLQNFREGVARSIGDDDYESHYDLGVAYKEMGLLDDAVAEFQRALRSPTHRLPAYEALGQCFLEQGSFPVAVTVLSRALHEPGLDDEQRVGVLYLLGYACEALQRRDEARSYYQRVYATDIHFRDVAERLTALDGSAR